MIVALWGVYHSFQVTPSENNGSIEAQEMLVSIQTIDFFDRRWVILVHSTPVFKRLGYPKPLRPLSGGDFPSKGQDQDRGVLTSLLMDRNPHLPPEIQLLYGLQASSYEQNHMLCSLRS